MRRCSAAAIASAWRRSGSDPTPDAPAGTSQKGGGRAFLDGVIFYDSIAINEGSLLQILQNSGSPRF